MATFASSYIPTGSAAVSRNADQLKWPHAARPQAMTVYVRFIESGSRNIVGANIIHVGSSTPSGDPRFVIDAVSTGYRVLHDNANTTVSAQTSALGALGDGVELLGTLASNGAVRISQSINGATITSSTETGGAMLGDAWAGQTLWMNSAGTQEVGYVGLRNLVVNRGVQTMATMRRLAGV
jgi:hypothetical protein